MNMRLQICAMLATFGLAGTVCADPLAPEPGAPGGHGPIKVMVIVSSHGLNLSSREGADLFLRRLESAVDRACDERPATGLMALARSATFHSCRDRALTDAMAYVHSPLVHERYAELQRHDGMRLAGR